MDGEKRYRITKRSSELVGRVSGANQGELLANSAFALFDLITDLDQVQVRENLSLEVEGIDADDLLVNWIRELLYLFQGSSYLLKEFEIREAKDFFVCAEVRGEKFDPDRHEIQQDIRSVVYHQCRMTKTGSQWTAQLIFEI